MSKIKAIIDTDPGVDDTTALVLSFFDRHLDIKLLTTVSGNIPISVATKNVCFLLDLFNKDIPVAKGAAKALNRKSDDARWLHGKHGLGDITPPKETEPHPLKDNTV